MVQIEIDGQEKTKAGKPVKIKKQVHKLQLLDVATGTGTFLAEIVKRIYAGFKGQEGVWSGYVEQHLLPRMHGFELLMASYAMCHMKLDLLLKETGYQPSNPTTPPRLGVYLTNSLEEHHPDTDTLFAQWLSKEANEASRIKKDMPIMVALGNPPYSGISSNMSSWIARTKIEDYKYVNGVHFGERKHWLNDDYAQFIRLGEHYIEKNGEGILAYITNHGYLENPTFRGMRWHLLNTFDDIYILDLHGRSQRQATTPENSEDKNVFDIQKGVAIMVAIKRRGEGKTKPLANVRHADLWGSRETKYQFLGNQNIVTVGYHQLDVREPFYFFIPQNYESTEEYKAGFAVDKLYSTNVTGILTARDQFAIDVDEKALSNRIKEFCDRGLDTTQFQVKYHLDPTLDKLITAYPVTGNHEVVALRCQEAEGKPGLGRVWINPTQYFDNVPLTAWELPIGGYQPAQKWLKDRKGRKLTSHDLRHYQRIIVALTETDKTMNEIAKVDFLPKA